MNIILTAFHNNKHDDAASHAAKNILRLLPEEIQGVTIKKVILPLVFGRCFDVLEPHIDSNTIAVLPLGSAGGSHIAIERIAVNIMHSNGPDNDGYRPVDEPIRPGAPNAYFTTLPFRQIERTLQEQGYPVAISNSAGLTLCNNIFYLAAHHAEQHRMSYQYGFLHIPHMSHEDNEGLFTMELSDLITCVRTVLSECIRSVKR